ncbi:MULTISPECIES: MFS transporter [unclassified Burkholderia]|uniref:MFS transporter n=1 Tax=unclassified Burkholderia TaxID=2613784 RepID=UPI0016279341|nr:MULTISPECIES: MFS transporter [unclassified Burkholderia]
MRLLSRASFESDRDDRLYNRIASKLLPYLILLLVVSFVDRVNVGFAKLQMASDIGLSDLAYGTGAGLFFVGYCAFEIPANLILQRVGARAWLGAIMLIWGVISAGMAFVTDAHEFYVMRVLLGVAEAGCYPGVMLYMTYWFPPRLRSQVCAIFFLGLTFGGMLGGPLSGWILQSAPEWGGLRGWQWLFILEALPAIGLSIVTFRWLANGPRDAVWLAPDERVVVYHAAQGMSPSSAVRAQPARVRDALASPTVWLMMLANFALLGGAYGVSFWLPQVLRSAGSASMLQIGMLSAVPYLFSGACMVLVARHSDRVRERRWHSILPMLLSVAGFGITAMATGSVVWALAGLTLAVVGAQASSGVLWSVPATLFSGSAAGTALAMVTIGGNLGGYAIPYMIGYTRSLGGGFALGFQLLCAIQVVGIAALLLIPARRFVMEQHGAPRNGADGTSSGGVVREAQ